MRFSVHTRPRAAAWGFFGLGILDLSRSNPANHDGRADHIGGALLTWGATGHFSTVPLLFLRDGHSPLPSQAIGPWRLRNRVCAARSRISRARFRQYSGSSRDMTATGVHS